MTDRNVQHPKRYQMVPVQGTTDIVDLTPAPGEIYAEGTLINKATLLKDATAALFGLGTDAVPDDVFAWLGKYNQYWWRRRTKSGNIYIENKTDLSVYADVAREDAPSYYSKSIYVSPISGTISLNSPTNCTVDGSASQIEQLAQTLVQVSPVYYKTNYNGEKVYYIPEGATYEPTSNSSTIRRVGSSSTGIYLRFNTGVDIQVQDVTVVQQQSPAGEWQYIYSSNRSAYPDSGTQDGYEYEYLGIPFDNAVGAPKIETGSYVGTGTYGASNPNKLTFGFEPKIVLVYSNINFGANNGAWQSGFIWAKRITRMSVKNAVVGQLGSVTFSLSGNTLSWYSSADQYSQLNSGKYYYSAIG